MITKQLYYYAGYLDDIIFDPTPYESITCIAILSRMLRSTLYTIVLFLILSGCAKKSPEDHNQHGANGADLVEHDALAVAVASTNRKVFSNQALVKPILQTHSDTVKAYGFITLDERRSNQVAARVGGRIEKLYVKYENQYVRKGQKIMDLYSVDLNTFQEELRYAYKADPQSEIVEHAAHKLKLLGIADEQIQQIKETGKTFFTLTIYSLYDGYIFYGPSSASMAPKAAMASSSSAGGMGGASSERASPAIASLTGQVREGVYVTAGQTLYWINDLHEVWGILSVDNRQMEELALGDSVAVVSEMFPGKPIRTVVRFIEPQYAAGQKFIQMRVYLPNQKNRLRINSLLEASISSKTQSVLTLPASGILYLGGRQAVWRKVGETAEKNHILQIQFVQTGPALKGRVSVLSGLAAKDEVALDAGYLLDRESLVKPE